MPQRFQSHVQPDSEAMQTKSLMKVGRILAPMGLEHRPREAVSAGDCLWLHTTCYATGGLGAATVHVEFSRPQSSLVLSPRRKYNQTSFAALPRANPPTPQRFQSHVQPGFKTKPDSSFAVDANLLTSMQVEHRPCEAVLAGSRSCLHTTCYATGGGVGGTKYRAAGGG